jgi:hypothetical protein
LRIARKVRTWKKIERRKRIKIEISNKDLSVKLEHTAMLMGRRKWMKMELPNKDLSVKLGHTAVLYMASESFKSFH